MFVLWWEILTNYKSCKQQTGKAYNLPRRVPHIEFKFCVRYIQKKLRWKNPKFDCDDFFMERSSHMPNAQTTDPSKCF